MEKKLAFSFLVKSTIPYRKKSNGKQIEPPNRIQDAVHRAHRDVLTGARFYCPEYKNCCEQKEKNGLCKIENSLADYIIGFNPKEENTALFSKALIEYLKKEYENVEFGAIQKLVNMTLKYILILNAFEKLGIPVDEQECDCPIDSVILNKLGETDLKWTQINEEDYLRIQERIANEKKDCPRIYYDFKNWQ